MESPRKKILIVDDEEKIRALYIRAFIEAGFLVRVASSAREATNLIIREDFDLVLLDINMPEIDGRIMFEVIQEFNAKIKVIIISVYEKYEQKEMIPQAEYYFDKSQGIFLLIDKVRDVLGMEHHDESNLVTRYTKPAKHTN